MGALYNGKGKGKNKWQPLGKGRGVKPDTAKIVSSTGDATFDGYLLDALYGWLAKGEKLKTLGPGETTLVRLTLLMR